MKGIEEDWKGWKEIEFENCLNFLNIKIIYRIEKRI